MQIYMIRRPRDGLYSTGGAYPYFSKFGKVWTRKHLLRAHLRIVADPTVYNDCAVVTMTMEVSESTPIQEWVQ